ncbi:hypothetical protein AAMO2058_000446800 [Amorphochlora amoebiformis]
MASPRRSRSNAASVLYTGTAGTDEKDPIAVKVAIGNRMVGRIIGKGGSTIEKYKKDSGAQIALSASSGEFRFATVTGTVDQVSDCLKYIAKGLKENTREGDRDAGGDTKEMSLSIICSSRGVGYVIGKGGRYVKAIREESRATITISDFVGEDRVPAMRVLVVGTERTLQTAVELICRQIASAKASGISESTRSNKPSTYSSSSVDRSMGMYPYEGTAGPYGGMMMNPYSLAPKTLDQVMVQARLAGINPKLTFQVKVLMETKDAGKIFGQGGTVIQKVQEASGCTRIRFSEQAKGASYRTATLEGSSPSIVIGLCLFSMLLCGSSLRPRCSITLLVNARRVGYIIGKAGARIKKIRQESGAEISISTEEYSYGDSDGKDNKVAISGSPAGVSKAISRTVYHLQQIADNAVGAIVSKDRRRPRRERERDRRGRDDSDERDDSVERERRKEKLRGREREDSMSEEGSSESDSEDSRRRRKKRRRRSGRSRDSSR